MMKRYSNKEIKFLKNNYPTKGSAHCAKKLGRNQRAIKAKANKLGLKILRDMYLTLAEKEAFPIHMFFR